MWTAWPVENRCEGFGFFDGSDGVIWWRRGSVVFVEEARVF